MSKATRGHAVLVVEDDPDVRQSIAEVLADNDYLPVLAGNGEEAFAQLHARKEPPCVILLDLMMPVMDGWEFRRQQRANPRLANIPVVVMSAIDGDRLLEIEPVAAFRKPLAFNQVIDFLQRICH